MFEKIKGKIIFSLALGALIFVGLSVYADFDDLVDAFRRFNWLYLPLILSLSFMNYMIRFVKWNYYTDLLSIKLEKKDSLAIFLSGFIMSVTPGKMGEVFKSYLLKQLNSTPISHSAPIVFAERITDFIALIMLAAAGAYVIGYGKGILLLFAVFFAVLILVMSSRQLSVKIISLLEHVKFMSSFVHKIHQAYNSVYTLIQFKSLLIATGISLIGWFLECLGFFIVLEVFDIHLRVLTATFIYAFSTIVGAASFLPGGLGVTEGSLAGLLILAKIPKHISVASTFIIRASTLWFAVVIGAVVLMVYQKRLSSEAKALDLQVDKWRRRAPWWHP